MCMFSLLTMTSYAIKPWRDAWGLFTQGSYFTSPRELQRLGRMTGTSKDGVTDGSETAKESPHNCPGWIKLNMAWQCAGTTMRNASSTPRRCWCLFGIRAALRAAFVDHPQNIKGQHLLRQNTTRHSRHTTFNRQRVPYRFGAPIHKTAGGRASARCIGGRCHKEQVTAKTMYLMQSCRSFVDHNTLRIPF